MSLKPPATSAGRLQAILTELQSVNPNTACLEAWASVLKLPESDLIKLIPTIYEVGKLPDIVAADLESALNRDVSKYTSWVPVVKRPFETFRSFKVQVNHFTQGIDNNVMSLLTICDDQLSIANSENVLDEEMRVDALQHIRKAYEAVQQDGELDPLCKRYLIRYLDLVERALVEYKIFGVARSMEHIETVVGIAAVSRYGPVEFTKSGSGQLAIDAIKKATFCVQVAQSAQWLLSEGRAAVSWLVETTIV